MYQDNSDEFFTEGAKFKIHRSSKIGLPTIVTAVISESYPMYTNRKWMLLDSNGVNHDDEWYFFDGAYLEEIK